MRDAELLRLRFEFRFERRFFDFAGQHTDDVRRAALFQKSKAETR